MSAIRIVVVDDHPLIRAALRMVLEQTGQIQVVAEGADGDEAATLYFEHQPDVLILDLQLPRVSGLDAVRRIRARDGAARILIFSMHENMLLIARVLSAGAMGYLSKGCADKQLVQGVLALAAGKPYLDPTYASDLACRRLSNSADDPLNSLSQREFQVLRHLAQGDTVAETADTLFIAAKTVSSHQASVMKKLGLKNVAQLVRFAIRNGIIEP
jgi:two-component system invasion response regulator UvrY